MQKRRIQLQTGRIQLQKRRTQLQTGRIQLQSRRIQLQKPVYTARLTKYSVNSVKSVLRTPWGQPKCPGYLLEVHIQK